MLPLLGGADFQFKPNGESGFLVGGLVKIYKNESIMFIEAYQVNITLQYSGLHFS